MEVYTETLLGILKAEQVRYKIGEKPHKNYSLALSEPKFSPDLLFWLYTSGLQLEVAPEPVEVRHHIKE